VIGFAERNQEVEGEEVQKNQGVEAGDRLPLEGVEHQAVGRRARQEGSQETGEVVVA
jgi:hypothetical protein